MPENPESRGSGADRAGHPSRLTYAAADLFSATPPRFLSGLLRPLQTQVSDVWRVDLDHAPEPSRLVPFLSPVEQDRAGRFVSPVDRERYVVAHFAVRSILGFYLALGPREVVISTDPSGRPGLDVELRRLHSLDFNLSHSRDVAIIGITNRGPIGVDVERVRLVPDLQSMVERYLTQPEVDALQGGDEAARHRRFLSCWVRKEAVLKCVGLGLSVDPASFAAGPGPDFRSVRFETPPLTIGIQSLDLGSETMAAAAMCGDERVRRLVLPSPAGEDSFPLATDRQAGKGPQKNL